jgi:glycosyltransferase involved in cell wall biosynthesis
MPVTVSVLIPCLNEEKYIKDCLESVKAFDLPFDVEIEVFILDGGSIDKTLDIVSSFCDQDRRFQLLDNPGKIQSSALNLGIEFSQGTWIMRLDAHTSYPINYLKLCFKTAISTGADNVGGVCITLPGSNTYQAKLIQSVTTHRFGVGNSGFRVGAKPGYRDTVPFGFFKRDVFDKVGLFDERLVRTQDYEMNRRIKVSGGSIYFNPEIRSSYFNLGEISKFLKKQFFRQGPYNVYMWYLAPYSFVFRHSITGVFTAYFLFCLFISPFNIFISSSFGLVLSLYFLCALVSSTQQTLKYRDARHLFCLPFLFFLFHICHGAGILVGIFKVFSSTAPIFLKIEPWAGAGRLRAWRK